MDNLILILVLLAILAFLIVVWRWASPKRHEATTSTLFGYKVASILFLLSVIASVVILVIFGTSDQNDDGLIALILFFGPFYGLIASIVAFFIAKALHQKTNKY
jgi:glucan phosphoethanolaminetransferase (alkaline phosphatase superfamily)